MSDFQKQTLIIGVALIGYSSLLFLIRYFTPSPAPIIITGTGVVQTGSNSTGAISTGSLSRADYLANLTGTGLETVEAKVSYVFSFGDEGNDFITITPTPQDITLGATKSSNNILIQSFVQKHQYSFSVDKSRKGYLVVKTQRRIPDAKDVILAINGKRLGSFHKTSDSTKFKSDVSDNYLDSLYIFPLESIDIAQQQTPVNLLSYDPLGITIVVGENNNSVTSLSIVYVN